MCVKLYGLQCLCLQCSVSLLIEIIFSLFRLSNLIFSHLKIKNSNNWHEIINKTVKHLVDEERKKALNSTSMLAEMPGYSYGQGSSPFQVKWI